MASDDSIKKLLSHWVVVVGAVDTTGESREWNSSPVNDSAPLTGDAAPEDLRAALTDALEKLRNERWGVGAPDMPTLREYMDDFEDAVVYVISWATGCAARTWDSADLLGPPTDAER